MRTSRLEAFSDGVIAVAITLLVLDLAIPAPGAGGHSLAHNLGAQWQDYAAYVVSFVTIGIIWINHHAALQRLREADHTILVINVLLLMTVVALPFATSLMAKYLKATGGDQSVAAAVYAGTFLAMGLAFSLLNWQILARKPQLMRAGFSPQRRSQILRRSVTGVLPYAVAAGLAFVTSYLTLGICAAVALFYALPVEGLDE